MATLLLTIDEVAVLKGMDDSKRPLYLDVIANARRVTLAEVEKAYTDLLGKADERVKAEAAKVEAEKRAKRVDTLRTDIEAFRLDSDSEGEGNDFLMLSELRDQAIELGVVVTFAGLVDGEPRFSLGIPAPVKAASTATAPANGTRGGGTGAGRPAADAAQPFTTPDGKRVVGPVTLWLKANVDKAILTEKGLMKADGSLKGSGSVVAAAAVKAGILVESPVPAAAPAAPATATPGA